MGSGRPRPCKPVETARGTLRDSGGDARGGDAAAEPGVLRGDRIAGEADGAGGVRGAGLEQLAARAVRAGHAVVRGIVPLARGAYVATNSIRHLDPSFRSRTSKDPFSSVSKPILTTKYALENS